MTMQEAPAIDQTPPRPDYDDDDEIDLRVYLDILINWWREIALITVLSALAAGGLVFALRQAGQPQYQATSTAVIARISSSVNFDERFQTTSNESTAAAAIASRRASLLGLAKSGAIAQAVIDEFGDQLPPDLQEPAALLEHVGAELAPGPDARTPSDLIEITVTMDDPEQAAAVANAWSRYYVDEVNAIYGQVPEDVIASVEAEQAKAKGEYQRAQKTFEDFIAASRISALTRQINADQALLDALKQGQIDAATAVIDRDMGARLELFNRLVDAETVPSLALIEEQTTQNVRAIADLLATRTLVAQALDQARSLQIQIDQGNDAAAASNALALQLLKTQIFASTSVSSTMTLPMDLQLNAPGIADTADGAAQQTDVAALTAALEERLARIDVQLETLGRQVLNNDNYQFVDELTARGFTLTTPDAGETTDETGEKSALTGEQSASALSQAIVQSAADLFGLGAAAQVTPIEGANDDLTRTITELEQRVQDLRAQLEAEQATKRQLTQQRDLAWTAYDTLNNKVVELNLARSAANSEVRPGPPAVPPVNPVTGQSLIVATALGGAVGFMFAIFLIFFAAYLGKEPPLRRRSGSAT